MERDRFLERVSAAKGIFDVLTEIVDAAADTIGRLEERIEKLEASSPSLPE